MELKVDPARINGLADEVRRLEQQFGDQVTVTLKRVSEVIRKTSSAYSESGVRLAVSEVERLMERIRQLSREIGDELRTKEKTLRWAADEYTRQEQESSLKAKQLKLPVTLNKFAALPTISGNKTTVLPFPFSAFSLFSRAAVYLPITVEPLTKELTLDPEHKSDEVLKLQERLHEMGYELEANGYFDSATLEAINRYKEKYELDNAGDRQGIVDENVWRTLFGTLSGLLTKQMHGQTYSEPVKMAQLRLQELGFEVEANGYFDEATVRALKGFREVYEKDQDGLEGVIGPATWQALFNMPKVEPVEESKSEPQYYITSVDPRSYSMDDVLNRDNPEVQERLKQTYWADLTKEEQDRIYNELKELEKKEENEMRQKRSGIGNPFVANLMVGGSNAVVNTINTASAGLPELLAEWIMGPEPEGYVNPLDDPYGKGVGEAAGNVVGFLLPFKYLKAVKTPAVLSKLSPTVVRSMTAGAIFGTATEASDAVTDFKNDGEQNLTDRAQNIALDTALAGAGDVTFTYAFKLISNALKSTAGQKLTGWLKRSEVDEVPATKNVEVSGKGAIVGVDEQAVKNALEKGSEKTWKEFLAANPGKSVEDASKSYIKLIEEQSPWPEGFDIKANMTTLKPGDTFQMALDSTQPLTSPGNFATFDDILNTEFVRSNLAVKSDWKADCSKVVTYRVKEGVELPVVNGPVGPQVDLSIDKYLPGGSNQIQMLLDRSINKMDYLEIVSVRQIN
ncbi:hypothetical protein EHV15_31380 [Paenibacillus oralis]|uniref:Peptidoglycan binding-like domain-containing protein n=1 Tax=Paenibacillus oralis TaxID=2490856 RepID=A0A3P3UBM7_9BACL|nr:peptidoglycan-binding protein [Paenibacillus oralis]RRJ66929.1 hypothetical protein EHV15_31380 [Paenibacillus oralis]